MAWNCWGSLLEIRLPSDKRDVFSKWRSPLRPAEFDHFVKPPADVRFSDVCDDFRYKQIEHEV